jgi:uncharacterized protein YlxW (UPF0749 family)
MGEMQVREATTVQQLRDENQQLQQRYQHLESEIQSKDIHSLSKKMSKFSH